LRTVSPKLALHLDAQRSTSIEHKNTCEQQGRHGKHLGSARVVVWSALRTISDRLAQYRKLNG
jgi:hypothetical protein